MSAPIPIKKDSVQSVKLELATEEIVDHIRKILEIKEKAMQENIHYGIIPGYDKPSLWKPGAEILCRGFRLEPEFETSLREDWERTIKWEKRDGSGERVLEEGMTKGYVEYDTKCTLIHIPTGEVWTRNVSGSCNNFEAKYRSLNPHDVRNTLEKMAEKRSLVGATLIGVGASDIFTQDLEDIPYLGNGRALNSGSTNGQAIPSPDPGDRKETSEVRYATKKQVDFLKDQIKKKGFSEKDFFEAWSPDFTSWGTIPFEKVNPVLVWIREKRPKEK